jgi:hypothetical protein
MRMLITTAVVVTSLALAGASAMPTRAEAMTLPGASGVVTAAHQGNVVDQARWWGGGHWGGWGGGHWGGWRGHWGGWHRWGGGYWGGWHGHWGGWRGAGPYWGWRHCRHWWNGAWHPACL